jgi:hypothetical protein
MILGSRVSNNDDDELAGSWICLSGALLTVVLSTSAGASYFSVSRFRFLVESS